MQFILGRVNCLLFALFHDTVPITPQTSMNKKLHCHESYNTKLATDGAVGCYQVPNP